jgi:hypothetical protein
LQTLMIIEDKLAEIYGQSCLLAKYLMSVGLTKMEEVVSALSECNSERVFLCFSTEFLLSEMEANDIPLLLAVASTHSPEVAAKYGISVR